MSTRQRAELPPPLPLSEQIGERKHPKSAPPMYTEREMVLAQRKAFAAGAKFGFEAGMEQRAFGASQAINEAWLDARRRFPLPKVTRPRVVTDRNGNDWRYIPHPGEGFQYRADPGHHWMTRTAVDAFLLDGQMVALWADLLANPTEEVEDES